MRSALNSSVVWILATEGDILFQCGIVRGGDDTLGYHCMSGIYNSAGTQWLSGRVLDSRTRGCGFERQFVVVLEQDTFILA